jgi:gas vesicle protein
MGRMERLKDYEAQSARNEGDGGRARDIAFLVAGAGIGAGVALLLAPSSGEEVRHAIGRGYRKTVKRISRRTQDLRDRAEDLLEHAQDLRDHAHDLRERGAKLLRFGRGRGEEAVRRYREA